MYVYVYVTYTRVSTSIWEWFNSGSVDIYYGWVYIRPYTSRAARRTVLSRSFATGASCVVAPIEMKLTASYRIPLCLGVSPFRSPPQSSKDAPRIESVRVDIKTAQNSGQFELRCYRYARTIFYSNRNGNTTALCVSFVLSILSSKYRTRRAWNFASVPIPARCDEKAKRKM